MTKILVCALVAAFTAGCGGGGVGSMKKDGGRDAVDAAAGDASANDGAPADDGATAGDASEAEVADAPAGADAPGDAAPDAPDAADGAVVQCTPGTKQCANATAEVCVAAGNAWNRLACPNGCENGACKPLSLETGWKVHQYNLTDDGIQTPASYAFEMNGLIAVQSANPMASVYYNDTSLPEGVIVTGKFGVHTASDDDLVGFVFGWQDPEHYYLFDWKQATQADSTCGTANAGASLKLVSSATPIDKCADLWDSAGTTKVKPLVTTATNPTGWEDNVDYDLKLTFRPGAITIEVMNGATKVISITSTDTTYRAGKFGFFNYSQEAVRYEFFSISPIP